MTSGGKLYGEGAKGRVEDTRCIFRDTHTFCKQIDNELDAIERITLYHAPSSKLAITKKNELVKVIGLLTKSPKTATKTYKGSDPHTAFHTELKANQQVLDALKAVHHSIMPAFTWYQKPVYGLTIDYTQTSLKAATYHMFSEACASQILEFNFTQDTFNKFIKEIKEGLDALHAAGIHHNDVKPNNMIYCPQTNRFKLIDWELASSIPTKPYDIRSVGTSFFNHPLKFYAAGIPAFAARKLMAYNRLIGKHAWVKKLKALAIVQSLATSSIDYILERYSKLTKKQLHAKFAPHYDNFAFGVSILLLADKHKLKAPKHVVDELFRPFMPSFE